MAVVELQQGSAEWHRWRLRGLTASEAAVILGRDEHTTELGLYRLKKGLAVEASLNSNPHVRRGHREEPIARRILSQMWGESLQPCCIEWNLWPVLRASLDGQRPNGEPVEIKHPSEKVFAEVVALKERSAPYQRYLPQVQQQILVTGAQQGWLVFRCEKEIEIFPVAPSPEILRELVRRARVFWHRIEVSSPPPAIADDYYFPGTDEEAKHFTLLADHYLRAQAQEELLKQQIESLKQVKSSIKAAFSAFMGIHRRCEFAGVRIAKSEVKGKVPYRQLYYALGGTEAIAETHRATSRSEVKVAVTGQALPVTITDATLQTRAANASSAITPNMHF